VSQDRPQQTGSLPSPDGRQASGAPGALPVQSKRRTASGWAIGLAAVWPEMLANVPPEDRALAERALLMPLVTVVEEDLAGVMRAYAPGAFDFLIADGVVLKETVLARHRALELLGPGDLLAPPLTPARQMESRSVSRYLAHGHVSLVAINARFGQTARRWPAIADLLHERLGRQTHRASMHAAMLHLPRIEDRLVALFADLAERFGRVSTAGVLVDLPLTHEVIGGLVGSRRPTVSLALKELASQGLIGRQEHDRWTLSHSIVSA
jgi:CRP/FNR family cyclic AMP-dependent transcriptional regulator